MSLWFRKRDKQGRLHYFSVNIPLLLVVAVIGILLALLLPVLARWR
jgi:hypothetical protein